MPIKSFQEGIIDLFYKGATSSKKVRRILTSFGVVFFLGIVFMIYLSFQMDRLLGFPKLIPGRCGLLISLPVLITGFCLWLWSVWKFMRAKGTPVPFNPPPALVVDGPYAYMRNPMMLGVFMLLIGIGIFSGSLSLTVIFVPAFILIVILEIKYIEEPELEKRLGEEYLEYRKNTPMMIPKIKKNQGQTQNARYGR